MTIRDVQQLYEYDRWANNKVLRLAAALPAEQFTRNPGGGGCVRDTLVHIIGGEWGWLEYWRQKSPSTASLEEVWTRHDALFQPARFPDAAAVQLKWKEIEESQVEFVNGLRDESLERKLPFFSKEVTLAQLMQHLTNHSTYHRGQIALLLRQLGAAPAATDFHVFLLEGGSAETTAR